MNSDISQHQQQGSISALLRFRSVPAPSSMLTKGDSLDCFLDTNSPQYQEFDDKLSSVKKRNDQNMYSYVSSMSCRSQLPPQVPRQNSDAMDSSYRASNPVEHHHQKDAKRISGACSNLVRQSSSPAGFFSHSVQNGYGSMNTTSNFQVRSGKSGEINSPSCGFKSPNNFSPGLPYSSGLFSHISEIGSERITINTCDYGSHKNGNSESHFYTPFVSGYEPADLNDNFPGVKNNKHIKLFACSNSTEFQNGEQGNGSPSLLQQLALPKPSAEMDKLLHFQGSIPCKIRAKRGCATHPRSIAERVRRTRISERMRKLQELVPHMDKQTSTADMLDLAVDYIKDLQKQFKALSDIKANCRCLCSSNPEKKLANFLTRTKALENWREG